MVIIPVGAKSIGYKALVERFSLKVIPHFRWSYIWSKGTREQVKDQEQLIFFYDKGYALKNDDPFLHLEFALKHEGMNLEIIQAIFLHIVESELELFVKQQPTSKYARMMWYLYEFFTQKKLALEDLKQGSYVNLLDPAEYYTIAQPLKSRRHRVNDNLLGTREFCPLVRKTERLIQAEVKKLDVRAQVLTKDYAPTIIKRAGTYLYVKETRSSTEIERERPSKQRLARFIALLEKIDQLGPLDKELLIRIQNVIVDERFINRDYRMTQNYVGEQVDLHHEKIHYISPLPVDVEMLMQGLLKSFEKMSIGNVHPIVVAATLSFGFVFIHPFDDGNGRIHRFLIHYILARMGFTQKGLVFPLSALMLNELERYNAQLESFSKPLMELVSDYELSDKGVLTVHQQTKYFYQYIDYTKLTEYLFESLEKTIETYFKRELSYLQAYDKTKKAVQEIVDMPDRLIDLFIMLVIQNKGFLSQKKKNIHFSMLTASEIEALEVVVKKEMKDFF